MLRVQIKNLDIWIRIHDFANSDPNPIDPIDKIFLL